MEKQITTAIARSTNLPISTKFSIEISDFIRNKPLAAARKLLEGVIEKKVVVPFTKYKKDLSHKKGNVAAGRYPINAAKSFLILLRTVEANAENKGLNANKLFITKVISNRGEHRRRYGRKGGKRAKTTHLFIEVQEQ